MNRVRVGIIGLGVGARHLTCFQSHPDCEVVAVCDHDTSKMKSAISEHPSIRAVKTAEELLQDSEIDAVSIASIDCDHFPQFVQAVAGGKHIFVEKPVCLYEEELNEMKRLLSLNPHLVFSSNHVLRLSSRFQELRDMIKSGKLGTVFHVAGDYQYGRLEKLTSGWRGEIPFYSIVLGGGVHVVDLLLWMLDDEVDEVFAYGSQTASKGSQFKFNDLVLATLKLRSGCLAKVSANFGCIRPHYHNIEVFGTKGTFLNGPSEAEFWDSTEKESRPRAVATPYRDYQKPDLIHSFVDACCGRTSPMVGFADVERATRTCLAIEESVNRGIPIQLSENL